MNVVCYDYKMTRLFLVKKLKLNEISPHLRCVWCGVDLAQCSGHANPSRCSFKCQLVNGEGGRLGAMRRGGRPERRGRRLFP